MMMIVNVRCWVLFLMILLDNIKIWQSYIDPLVFVRFFLVCKISSL